MPRRDERGTSTLEFALVSVLLLTLVLGIIAFGILLQRKQQDVQAAAEGTRAGVGTAYSTTELLPYLADPSQEPSPIVSARAAVNQSMADTGRRCAKGDSDTFEAVTDPADGLRCPIAVYSCLSGTQLSGAEVTSLASDPATTVRVCIRVRVIDENQGSFRVVPDVPLLSAAMPSVMRATSVAELGGLIQ